MSDLQRLHDYYLKTKPSVGKVQSASKLLIRLCKHLNLETPEDITPELYHQLPSFIDEYYRSDHHKAIQDKSTLAEMIGRYGPRDGWERAFEALLNDEDSNLRQFTLSSMHYAARHDLESVMDYLEHYAAGDDKLMTHVVARVINQAVTGDNKTILLEKIRGWAEENSSSIIQEILDVSERSVKRNAPFTEEPEYKSFISEVRAIQKEG